MQTKISLREKEEFAASTLNFCFSKFRMKSFNQETH